MFYLSVLVLKLVVSSLRLWQAPGTLRGSLECVHLVRGKGTVLAVLKNICVVFSPKKIKLMSVVS